MKLVIKDFKRATINKFQDLRENLDIKNEKTKKSPQRKNKTCKRTILKLENRKVQYLCEILLNEINLKNAEANITELQDQSTEIMQSQNSSFYLLKLGVMGAELGQTALWILLSHLQLLWYRQLSM